MRSRRIGEVEVGEVGLGTADVAMVPGRRDEPDAVRTIHSALDAGVTLIDTADTYAPRPDAIGHGERLVAKALATFPGDTTRVLVATKFGHIRTTDGGWLLDGRPEHVRRACDASLSALGVEAIGLYQYHRPTPRCHTGRPSARSASCGTPARFAWSALQTPTWSRSRRRGRRSASTASPRCRTSSRPGFGRASPSCGTAPSTRSRSCRGPPSAGSAARAASPPATPHSLRSRRRAASARSGSARLLRNHADLVAHIAALAGIVAWAGTQVAEHAPIPVGTQPLVRKAIERLEQLYQGDKEKTYRSGLAEKRIEPTLETGRAVRGAL